MSICSPAQKEGKSRRLHLAKRSIRSELSKIGNDIRAPDYALAAPCEGGSKASSGRDWRLDVKLHEGSAPILEANICFFMFLVF